MVETIQNNIRENEQMQYILLVSAIDPHYLYNTLNTVTALADMGRNKEVSIVNNALIGTLKDRLRMKNYKIYDTVLAEKNALDQYMIIQGYLVFVTIDYTFQVSKEDEQLIIPKNIIQPLVENSIKHGILQMDYDYENPRHGAVDVMVKRVGDYVSITVHDNGIGMTQEEMRTYFGSEKSGERKPQANVEHIGIYNVLLRLDYLYGNGYQVKAESPEGEGLTIELLLPMIKQETTK